MNAADDTPNRRVRAILLQGYVEAHGLDRHECVDCERPLERGAVWEWRDGEHVPVCPDGEHYPGWAPGG